jgi:hypothetical protein
MNDTPRESFPASVLRRLDEAGLNGAELVSSQPDSASFGDTSAVFRLKDLLLRIVRDRGEEFLDLGSASDPGNLFQYDDVEIAMGWHSVDDVLDKQTPEAIGDVLARMAARLGELCRAFSPERLPATIARVRDAEARRGKAFAARIRRG